MSYIVNSSAYSLSEKLPVFKIEPIMYQNQGRSFGPFLALFLLNLLIKTVTAKYFSNLPELSYYDPSPWIPYNRPTLSQNHYEYYSQWTPVKNHYDYGQLSYQPLTTIPPIIHQDYQDYSNDYDKLIPAESKDNIKSMKTTEPSELEKTTTIPPETTTLFTTTFNPTTLVQEPIPAESSHNLRRQPNRKPQRRGPSRRDKYPQRRRRPTTPAYYDSYEDYTERYRPNRRRRPAFQPQSTETYYDDDDGDYYDSFETTTRYYKKQKRRPTRRATKNPVKIEESLEIESSTQKINPNTEIVIVRQAASTTTAASTTGGSTTGPTTIITNSTVASTTASSNVTYGYGPSNGNEYISFTYSPPNSQYQYQVPYLDWYAQEATKNAIVKKVRDIVNTGRKLKLK